MTTTDQERPIYVCLKPSFFGNRLHNPGDLLQSKRHPGPNWRPFDPATDRLSVRMAKVPLDDFVQD
jgi:hypothetical protein